MFPDGSVSLRAGSLRWVCELQPSLISAVYRVCILYRPPVAPVVRVQAPALVPDMDGELPHIYPDGSLCLYEPGQWKHEDGLARSVVPWACEWLLHYEFWRATGEWHGSGGDHTGPVSPAGRPLAQTLKRRAAAA